MCSNASVGSNISRTTKRAIDCASGRTTRKATNASRTRSSSARAAAGVSVAALAGASAGARKPRPLDDVVGAGEAQALLAAEVIGDAGEVGPCRRSDGAG